MQVSYSDNCRQRGKPLCRVLPLIPPSVSCVFSRAGLQGPVKVQTKALKDQSLSTARHQADIFTIRCTSLSATANGVNMGDRYCMENKLSKSA